jgi:hypothetical protein
VPVGFQSANACGCHFAIYNLPYGVFSRADEPPRCCVALGDYVVDLAALECSSLLDGNSVAPLFDQPGLNSFMAMGARYWSAVRDRLIALLSECGDPALRDEVMALPIEMEFARKPMNSGRLSSPCSLADLPLQSPLESGLLNSGLPIA